MILMVVTFGALLGIAIGLLIAVFIDQDGGQKAEQERSEDE